MKALIEKLPRDLALYAAFVLRIIRDVLQSKDLSMVEESNPAFETFCKHHDATTLAADQDYINQYEEVVKTYASYTALKIPIQPKGGLNASVAVRWRTAGLKALKSITASDAISTDRGRQLQIIMPGIIQNLHSGEEGHLHALQQKAGAAESVDREQAMRRRMSIATVQTGEGSSRPTSASVAGPVDDVDRLAEEEVGILAIQSLNQIYTANNRAQVRLATAAMLKFLCTNAPRVRPGSTKTTKSPGSAGTWATALIEMVTKRTPVQDRFVIPVTILETLVKSPGTEDDLEQQLLLVSLIGWLLRSSVNMIGLSVMDVLLGLIQHVLLLLQLGGRGANLLPRHQQTGAIDLFRGVDVIAEQYTKDGRQTKQSVPSSNRQELLVRLQRCIGDLAVHVYYSEQISDIITAILLRLKPSPNSNVTTTAAAIEHPQAAAQAISSSGNLHENPDTDEFFSFGTARVTALKAIKEVLTVANSKDSVSGAAAIGRNRVGVQVWEGTQWLLRDEDRRVRRAYVDALLTWLRLEISSSDLRVWEDKRKLVRTSSKLDVNNSKREASSKKSNPTDAQSETKKPAKSTFLQLLHLAIYDNAVESPEDEDDLLLIHLLLYSLVDKLGVNSVKTGLPMILRLQEDIDSNRAISTPVAKLNIGSICHGYFWTLSEKFDFDSSTVGYVIQSEMLRRKKHHIWMKSIQVPPLPLDQISSATARPLADKVSEEDLKKESVRPFDARSDLVEKIAESYGKAVISPPNSPPASPGRVFSMPILSTTVTSAPAQEHELPPKIREAMLSEWSKDICIASVESEVTRASSLNGSRRGTNLSQRLAANGQGPGSDSPNNEGNAAAPKRPNDNDVTYHPNALNFALQNQKRHSSANVTGSATPMSTSDQNSTLRVDDLKRVLAGGTPAGGRNSSPLRHTTTRQEALANSVNNNERTRNNRHSAPSSDSVVSAEGFESASEGDLSSPPPADPTSPAEHHNKGPAEDIPLTTPVKSTPPGTPHSRNTSSTHPRSRPHSGYSEPATPRSLRRPSTSSSAANEDPEANAAALRGELPRLSTDVPEEVPPVPPLPAGVAPAPRPLSSSAAGIGGPLQLPSLEKLDKNFRRSSEDGAVLKSGENRERLRFSAASGRKRGVDVKALLGSIDAVAGDNTGRIGPGKPPY